jgi:hypothetical protein
MDPVRAIAPIIALACFALVTTRGMLAGNPAASTLKEALFAMFLGFVAGSLAQMIVAAVVDEHNREYAKANPVRPVGWTAPEEIVEVEEAADEPGTTAATLTDTGGANTPTSKKL